MVSQLALWKCLASVGGLVWRLQSVYDRTDVIEVLRQLCEDGFVRLRLGSDKRIDELGLAAVRGGKSRILVSRGAES